MTGNAFFENRLTFCNVGRRQQRGNRHRSYRPGVAGFHTLNSKALFACFRCFPLKIHARRNAEAQGGNAPTQYPASDGVATIVH